MLRFDFPVYIKELNGLPVVHANSDYGEGRIETAYYIYDEGYGENRLKVTIDFNNHYSSSYFDFNNCLSKGILKCPDFKEDPETRRLLLTQAVKQYRSELKRRNAGKAEAHTGAGLASETGNDDCITCDALNKIVLEEVKRLWKNNFYSRGKTWTCGELSDLERRISDELTCYGVKYMSPDDRAIQGVFEDNLQNTGILAVRLKEHGFTYFHYQADLGSFIKIMQCGKLYSRANAPDPEKGAGMPALSQTPKYVQESVRFYFNPAAPAFSGKEGASQEIPDRDQGNEQCSVTLLFDETLLLHCGTAVTNGYAGNPSTLITPFYSDALAYDWDTIFSGDPYKAEDEEITRKRNAEFLVPRFVDTDSITKIVFRSTDDRKYAEEVLGDDPRFEVDTTERGL